MEENMQVCNLRTSMQTQRTCLPLQYTPLDSVHTPTGVQLVPATYKKAHNIILTPISKSHAKLREMGDLEWNLQNNGKAITRSVSLRVDTWQCKIEPNHHYKVSDILTHTYKCKFMYSTYTAPTNSFHPSCVCVCVSACANLTQTSRQQLRQECPCTHNIATAGHITAKVTMQV